ncbi:MULTISPECIES: DUF262 domain-containing protein [Burkholderia]|uniref:DUF262 domain-containing protein n=1 Tax=Burkholderia TaxID=32008 RepID=UPI000B7AB488|nr:MULTISPECIES: DUF262 domain-containing protein [Burkholderia]OXJ00009.1 hypothetical protein CFB41_12430 [Burkholderia sp. AU33803]PRD90702.1 DUF262 domain-containing protein [Burkholderia contaminans]
MSLKKDVDSKRREISSDNLSMSIGELLNLYKEKELDIHPEFQRVYRWGIQQKSRLIESLLLGIPLPSLYVATNDSGVWEVIDGVQRLSTIFEFMGELKGPSDSDSDDLELKDPLKLEGTKHLPSLNDVEFQTMDHALRLEFKRTRLDIKVLAREQGASTGKFDLFERLNTYGEPLSPQELRNCVLVSLNPKRFRWLKSLAENQNFRSCTLLSESQIAEKYDMDLALRFVILRDAHPKSIGDVHEYLRDQMEKIAIDENFDEEAEAKIFSDMFEFLDSSSGGNIFRHWNSTQNSFRGGFSLAAYEGFGLAVGRHWSQIDKVKSKIDIPELIKKLWSTDAYRGSFSGLRARERMARVTPTAEKLIKDSLTRIKTRSTPTKKAVARKSK